MTSPHPPHEAGTAARNPVTVVELARAVVVIAGALGIATLDETIVTVVIIAVLVVISFGMQLWARMRVTPLVDPRDDDGIPLVRLDTGTPPNAAAEHREQQRDDADGDAPPPLHRRP